MSGISKGAIKSTSGAKRKAPKLGDLIANKTDAVAFISRKGADAAFIYPPGPKYNAETGVQVGWDEGVHLDFRGVGVTGPYFPETVAKDRVVVERVQKAIEDGMEVVHVIGLEVMEPEAAHPPFAKWDRSNAASIKVALTVMFDDDDHDANVGIVKQAAQYETENLKREDVLAVLQGLLATEAADSDAFDVEVSVS